MKLWHTLNELPFLSAWKSSITTIFLWTWFDLINLLVTCRQATHEICGEPSTQCSSGQPQCSAHGQRLREHYPRFPCFRILQCWMTAVWDEWWEDWESGTYPINSRMSRVFYLLQQRTLSIRYPLALCRLRSTGYWVSADERQFWKFLGFPPRIWTQDLQSSQPTCYHQTTHLPFFASVRQNVLCYL